MKGLVTMGGNKCGLEGPAVEMPSISREFKSVCGNASASVRSLLFYFSFERVLDEIIKARLRGKDDDGMLPPRKFWSRGGVKERRGTAKNIRRESIRRRVMKCWKDGTLARQAWGKKLLAFVAALQAKIRDCQVVFEKPIMLEIAKGLKDGRTEYRTVASFKRLEDRVVLNLATMYVRDRLEAVLTPSCYSFRQNREISHETAVGDLQCWRNRHAAGSMYVAECDIKKFFDNIQHRAVRERWRVLRGRLGFDEQAEAVVEAYLAVYGVDGLGIPQGGSLSTVLANLVLAAADDEVQKNGDDDLFYARYCDDVIFAHPDPEKCRAAMDTYIRTLETLGLPIHEQEDFAYREKGYYTIKTKGPFLWADTPVGEKNVAPWVSFVGSQIRFDGATRIRKESIDKHVRSLGRETAKAVREIFNAPTDLAKVSAGVYKWYSRFRNRLIAKGVGYVTEKIKDCEHCWAAAFGKVTPCEETRRQMRYLDRIRENMLTKVAKSLKKRGVEVKQGHRFKGNPFSYHAFLLKEAERPTSMRGKPRRMRYSDI